MQKLIIKMNFFYSRKNHSVEQPPQEDGRVPLAGSFKMRPGRVLDDLT